MFDKTCAKHGIGHRLTKPATPATNGMAERVNGMIKDATIKAITYANVEEMKADTPCPRSSITSAGATVA